MNILLLEDRGATAYNIIHWLEKNGHNVLYAYNPKEAQVIWQDRTLVPINCIILDLQVSMDGLTERQKKDAECGTLAGWVWLRSNVLEIEPKIRQYIIIYSEYISILREKVHEEQYRGIKLVPKYSPGQSNDEIFSSIREIARIVRA